MTKSLLALGASHRSGSAVTPPKLWTRKLCEHLFPLVAKPYSRAVAFPVSTADRERAFSAMNHIKTDLRSSLKTKTLEQPMLISLEGPGRSVFDFGAACGKRGKLKDRRIFSS